MTCGASMPQEVRLVTSSLYLTLGAWSFHDRICTVIVVLLLSRGFDQ